MYITLLDAQYLINQTCHSSNLENLLDNYMVYILITWIYLSTKVVSPVSCVTYNEFAVEVRTSV